MTIAVAAVLLLVSAAAQAQPAEAVLIASGDLWATEDFETYQEEQDAAVSHVAFGEDTSGQDMWMAVGSSEIWTSSDGYDWTNIWTSVSEDFEDMPINNFGLRGVAYGDGLWVVTTGDTETVSYVFGAEKIRRGAIYTSSDDGASWTKATLPDDEGEKYIVSVNFGDGTWIAQVGYWTAGGLLRSTDGTTWNHVTAGNIGGSYESTLGKDAAGNDLWMKGHSTNKFYSSTDDGLTWTGTSTSPLPSDRYLLAHDGVNTWVGVRTTAASSVPRIAVDHAGEGWQMHPTQDFGTRYSVAYHPATHTWITGGNDGNSIARVGVSRDGGATWIPVGGPKIGVIETRPHPPEAADLAQTNATAAPTLIPADGATAANIVVELRDASGKRTPAHPHYAFDYEVNLSTTLGDFGHEMPLKVNHTGDGTFRTNISSTTAGTATITAKIRASPSDPWINITDPDTIEIEFFPTPDPAQTLIASDRAIVNKTLSAKITVTTYDYEGNLYIDEDQADDANHDHGVTVQSTLPGTLDPADGAAAYEGDGDYSVTLNCEENATVTVTGAIQYSYNDPADPPADVTPDDVEVDCIDGPIASAALTTITSDDDEIQADGDDETTIRVQVVGELGDVITYDWYRVCLNTTIGTLSSGSGQGDCDTGYVNATYNPDGNYTANLTGTQGGFATIQGLLNGTSIGDDDTTVELLGGVPRVEDDPQYQTQFGKLLQVDRESGVLANDTDPEGDTGIPYLDLDAIQVTGPGKGPDNADSFTLNPDGSFTYTPLGGFVGTDHFTYKARDADGDESNEEATVTITVDPNQAPTIQDDAYTVAFGTTLNVPEDEGVLYNGSDNAGADSDPEGADLEAHLVAGFLNTDLGGSVVLRTNGSFTYTPPDPPVAGLDNFTYNVTDGYAWAGPATVQITISPNVAPTARDDTYSTGFETTLVVPHTSHNFKDVLDNDEDDTPEDVTLAVVTADTGQRDTAKGGNVTLNADGSFTYKPPALLENEDDWFWYNATDDYDESMAKVTINVAASGNNPPEAIDDGVYETAFGTQLVVSAADGVRDGDLQAEPKDGDPDNDTIDVVAQVSSPTDQGGNVTLNADGSFTYTPPAPPFSGLDNFTYKISDGYLESDPATVTIRVKENTPPTAGDDSGYQTSFDTQLVVVAGDGVLENGVVDGLLENDTDSDPEGVTLVARDPSEPANGQILLFGDDGSFTYKPDQGFQGQDSFTYEAWDGYASSLATVRITVADNQAPTAADDTDSVWEDQFVDIDVVANSDDDPDPNHGPANLNITAVSAPTPHGTAQRLDAHTIRYRPGQDRSETATFTYTVKDPAGATATATVEVTVKDINDAPVANPDGPYSVRQPSTLTVAARGVLANDDDVDDELDDLTAVPVSGPPGFTLYSNGGFTYQPPGGFTGRTSFEYQACDPDGACSDTMTVILDVQSPPPRANVAQNEPDPPEAPFVPETMIPAEAGDEVLIEAGVRPGSGSNAVLVWDQASGSPVTLVWDAERHGYVFTAPTPRPGQAMDLVFLIATRDGNRVSEAVEVTVHVDSENKEPVARAEARPTRVVAGQDVLLDASESFDPDGQALAFHWQQIAGPLLVELQDDDSRVASFLAPRIEDAGQPLVFVVVVSDAGGKHALANVTVTYVQALTQETAGNVIDADFQAHRRGQGQVFFRATGSDAAQYTWDLGDGKTATGPEVLHRYDQGGDFNVQLTVEDGEGSGTASKPVSVPDYVPVQEAKGSGVGWWLLGVAVTVSLVAIAVVALLALRSRK